jgi:GNAT superfamily N-acetyltransferase
LWLKPIKTLASLRYARWHALRLGGSVFKRCWLTMTVQYRPLNPNETSALANFWLVVYPDSGTHEEWHKEYTSIPGHLDHTFIAIDPGGKILSSVVYWVRHINTAEGPPLLAGHVSHVATRPDARRQGHAGNLMGMAIAAMRRDGCHLSSLYTSDEGRSIYERHGYIPFPVLYYREGSLVSAPPRQEYYVIRPYHPTNEPDGWELLAGIYSQYNLSRPFTVARDLTYWQTYIAMRYTGWVQTFGATLFVAARPQQPDDPCAYLLAHFPDANPEDNFERDRGLASLRLTEGAALPGEEAALQSLLSTATSHALELGITQARAYLPRDPQLDPILHTFFADAPQERPNTELMLLPLTTSLTQMRLSALLPSSQAYSWLADEL